MASRRPVCCGMAATGVCAGTLAVGPFAFAFACLSLANRTGVPQARPGRWRWQSLVGLWQFFLMENNLNY